MREVYRPREMWCGAIGLNCGVAVRAEHPSVLGTALRPLCDHLTCSKKVVHVFYNRENIKYEILVTWRCKQYLDCGLTSSSGNVDNRYIGTGPYEHRYKVLISIIIVNL